MYNCSKCGLGVIVLSNGELIRACTCKVLTIRKPITFLEKFKSFFGKKYYNEKNASVICSIEGHAKGSSQFNN